MEGPTRSYRASEYEIDPERLARVLDGVRARQSLAAAFVGGLVGALLGAAVWAAIAIASGRQIGFMALVVGALAGLGVRYFGRGIDRSFAALAAVFALVGCVAGNFLALVGFFAKHNGVPYFEALTEFGLDDPLTILRLTFEPMDLLFYAVAVWAAWRLARRGLTREEADDALRLRPVDRSN